MLPRHETPSLSNCICGNHRRCAGLLARWKSFSNFGRRQTCSVPLHFFDEEEARIVAAATERIFPSDEVGPGAKEAGVVVFIDRQLAGPYGQDRYRYTQRSVRKRLT